MPAAVADLVTLGVELDGYPFDGIRYVDPAHSVDAPFHTGPGRGVARTSLHAALSAAVGDAGIPVVHEAVSSVVPRDGVVEVDGTSTGHLVAADGLHSPVRRMLDLEAPARSVRRYGLRAHASTAPWSTFVEVHWSPLGEAYVTPVGADRVGVAVLTDRRLRFPELLASFTTLAPRLRDVTLSRPRGAGPLRQRSTARVRGRVMLVGDAAGYVDALTGEGIAIGLAQARAAIDAVLAADPERYERSWRRVTRRHDLMTHGLLTATRHHVVRQRIVPAAARLPRVFRAAVNQLARPA
jgi:flavin-dependent dehydrogenase